MLNQKQKQQLLRVTAIPACPTTHYRLPEENTLPLSIHVVQKITIIPVQKIGKSTV